jgi:flagellar hook-associated protein 2
MLGDSLLTGIESQLRRTLSGAVAGASGASQTLAGIGITTQADGSLKLDEAKLKTALTSNFDGVANLFGSENGVAAKLFSQVDERLKTGGAVESRSKNLIEQQKDLADRKDTVDSRMQVALQRYIKQFTALDTLLSSLQTTSSYLSQQLEQLSELSKSSLK